jgi:hypothetical protein
MALPASQRLRSWLVPQHKPPGASARWNDDRTIANGDIFLHGARRAAQERREIFYRHSGAAKRNPKSSSLFQSRIKNWMTCPSVVESPAFTGMTSKKSNYEI